jgi:uncharacterized protein (TIGR00661 family)
MRILYGVCSDGLGHAMRARVLAEELRGAGHELLFAAFGRPAALLRSHGFQVLEVRGLTCTFEGGAVRRGRTVLRALSETPSRIQHNARVVLNDVKAFAPDVTLTDFSGFACYAKLVTHCPVISIDHQHVIDRFHHPREITHGFRGNFAVARATVSAKTPGCDRFLVTSFFFPDPRRGTESSTRLTGPLLRPEIERLTATRGEHVLVYQTAAGDAALLETLRALPDVPFRVYGAGAPSQAGNVQLLRFDEAGFLADLASARAVLSNGGFSALSEAIYLDKPVLSIPVAHQGEQQLNAAWLSRLGLGMRGAKLTPELLRDFLRSSDQPRPARDPRLASGTRDFSDALTRTLAEVA